MAAVMPLSLSGFFFVVRKLDVCLQTEGVQYPFHNENWCRLKADSSLGCLTVPSCGEKNRARLQIKWTDHHYYFFNTHISSWWSRRPGKTLERKEGHDKGKGG